MPESSVFHRILFLALPALAQQYTFFFIQQYDQYLARFFSAEHQAALTTANYLYWFISSYSVVVSAGATALVGRMVGAKDLLTANRAAGQAILLAAIFGSFAAILAAIGLPTLMEWLKLGDNSPRIAVEYLTPLVAILVLQMIETGGVACLVGAGDTRTGLYVLLGVATVNIPVAYALSGGAGPSLDFGFTGIAMGTAVAHGLGGIAMLAILFRGRSGLKLSFAHLVPDFAMLYRLLRVSVPAAIDSMSVACCQLFFLSLVNRLGNEAAAAHGIAIRWEALGYLGGGAFGAAAMAMVSQSLGAKQPHRAARGAWMAFFMGGGLMTFMGVVFYALAWPMCRLYSPHQAGVVELAVMALRLIAFAMPAVAAWTIFTASLRAAGDTRVLVFISWFGFLGVRIPLALLLTQHWDYGLKGAWIAMVADLYVRGTLFVLRFASGKWKKIIV